MKKYALFFVGIFCLNFGIEAQSVNWRSLNEGQKNLVALNFGWDFGTNYGLAYGHHIPGKIPFVLGTEISAPFGNNLFDDWKIRLNGQAEIWHNDHFSMGLKPGILVRSYESDAAKLYSIGADLTTTFGYFHPKWGIAGEANYGKPLLTHIHHGILKEYYPAIKDGWFGAAGGILSVGISANYAFGTWNVFLKTGKAFGQNFKDNPTIPFYFDLSMSKHF